MKNLFLLSLTFIALFITPLNAQMQIGPKAGLNIANFVGDDANFFGIDLESRTGFTGGIFFMFQFSSLFAIQPEAYYTMKGAILSGENSDITWSLDYIEVPVLLKLIIPVEGSNIRPSVFAGPSVGFNTTAKIKSESEEQDIKEDVKSTDFGLVFGGGIGFMVGKNELGVDIRYILGLSSIDDSSEAFDLKNTAISFNVYFGFSLQ